MIAELLGALGSHAAQDEDEARHRAAMLELLGRGAESFSRAHFLPGHFTASCYIVDGAGRILLHHHRRLNRWLQMGGHVDGDEMPLAAALREGREESGLPDLVTSSMFDLDVHAIPAGKGEPDHEHFDVRFVARTSRPDAIARDAGESNELAWFTLARAAVLMPGPESQRAISKIERMLTGGFFSRRLHFAAKKNYAKLEVVGLLADDSAIGFTCVRSAGACTNGPRSFVDSADGDATSRLQRNHHTGWRNHDERRSRNGEHVVQGRLRRRAARSPGGGSAPAHSAPLRPADGAARRPVGAR
jgi:8-oxo-dGTP pyrophosphatase MutT (NUDIX family)